MSIKLFGKIISPATDGLEEVAFPATHLTLGCAIGMSEELLNWVCQLEVDNSLPYCTITKNRKRRLRRMETALPDEVLISDEKETHTPSSENQSKSPDLLKNPVTTDSEDEEKDDEAYSPITGGCEHPVPCPRCSSLNTRFCYFNNYCLDQPRHFCKECQRYWTNGGAMRDLPVGSGRRKRRRRRGAAGRKEGGGEEPPPLTQAGTHEMG